MKLLILTALLGLVVILSGCIQSESVYFIYPNTGDMGFCDFPGRYEVSVQTGYPTHKVFDHCVDCGCSSGPDTLYWNCEQIVSAIVAEQVIVVSGTEAGIRQCVGDDIWFNYVIFNPTCQKIEDCYWCGNVCKIREEESCLMVMPPAGYVCECVDSICQSRYVPVTPPAWWQIFEKIQIMFSNLKSWVMSLFQIESSIQPITTTPTMSCESICLDAGYLGYYPIAGEWFVNECHDYAGSMCKNLLGSKVVQDCCCFECS